MSKNSVECGREAAAFFANLTSSLLSSDEVTDYHRAAFERWQLNAQRNSQEEQFVNMLSNARADTILSFVGKTFGPDLTADETAFFYNTIEAEYRRGGDSFFGSITKFDEMTRRCFGFQGQHHLGEFLFLGIEGVRRMRRRENLWTYAWFCWLGAVRMAILVLAIGIYTYAQSPFETVAISLFLLVLGHGVCASQRVYSSVTQTQIRLSQSVILLLSSMGYPVANETRQFDDTKRDHTYLALRYFANRVTFAGVGIVAGWHMLGLLTR